MATQACKDFAAWVRKRCKEDSIPCKRVSPSGNPVWTEEVYITFNTVKEMRMHEEYIKSLLNEWGKSGYKLYGWY